ncbi:hypothetical protein KVR01_013717 [Diaporthe batatas]|uniref:uncharacterized protein n=1 Tax=Diaporthe batatas TaxID=748121 RepID=UPI001D04CF19|nr:uncharacterized protein KVR01_013717 [Diaporthe batatas]KAG8156376.1 hypothetical protein KVR01_013717 [Diaporthe batatas]
MPNGLETGLGLAVKGVPAESVFRPQNNRSLEKKRAGSTFHKLDTLLSAPANCLSLEASPQERGDSGRTNVNGEAQREYKVKGQCVGLSAANGVCQAWRVGLVLYDEAELDVKN